MRNCEVRHRCTATIAIVGVMAMLRQLRSTSGMLVILGTMIPLPKPRGFWDYTLSALVIMGILVFLFRLEASDGVG